MKEDMEQSITFVMSNETGRRFVYGVLELAGLDQNTFTTDPYTHAYNAGKRSVALSLISLIKEHETDNFFKMLKMGEFNGQSKQN